MNLSITTFLEPFFPDENEPIHLFGLDAKNCPDQLRQPRTAQFKVTRKLLKGEQTLQRELKHVNETCGLYFTVNAGGTKADEIDRINAVFAEIDDQPIDRQNDIFDNCLYPPSIRVETLRSIHAYWLMTGNVTLEDFARIQCGLIENLKSDPSIKNPNRLMRIPFFNHVSFDEGEFIYKPVRIHTFNKEIRYSAAEMDESFPFTEPAKIVYPKTEFAENKIEAVMQELRWRIMSHPTYRKAGEWGSLQGVCHSGQSKTALGLNLRSGKVHCFFGCEYKQILAAFGLEFPEKQKEPIKLKYIPRHTQSSKTYIFLKQTLEQQAMAQAETEQAEADAKSAEDGI